MLLRTWQPDSFNVINNASPGLLQLSFVRRHRQFTSTTAVCTERSFQVNHADWSPWTHLTSECSGLVVECRTRHREVAGSTHTRSTASNLEQVANLLQCAHANSASYPQRDGKWVVTQLLRAMGWRPHVADWGDGVSASCTMGPIP